MSMGFWLVGLGFFFPQTVQFLIDITGGAEVEGAMTYPVARLQSSMTTDTFTTVSVSTLAVPLQEYPHQRLDD